MSTERPAGWDPPDDDLHGDKLHDDDLQDAVVPDAVVPEVPGEPLHDDASLLAAVLPLVDGARDGAPSVWVFLLDADERMLPVVLPLADLPLHADPVLVRQLMVAMSDILVHHAPAGSVVLAFVRAAGGDRGAFERAWEWSLTTEAADQGVRVRAVLAVGEHRARVLGR